MTIANNENREFNELYAQYNSRILDASLRYSDNDKELAADAVQVSFMRLFMKLSDGERIHDYYNFLYTVAKNYTLNHVRKYSKVNFSDNIVSYSDQVCRDMSSEDVYLAEEEKKENKELVKAILENVAQKNPTWHYVIVEVFQSGRSQIEVAQELEISNEAMYATVRRIRAWANLNKLSLTDNSEYMDTDEGK